MKRLYIAILLAICSINFGCGDDPGINPGPDAGQAAVRLVHAAPAVPTLDVFFDTSLLAPGREFGSIQDKYFAVDAGEHKLSVFSAGERTSLANRSFTFHSGERYTLFVVSDTLGSADILLYRDNLTPPPAGKANVRIANLIPDAPAVRLAFSGAGLGPIFNNVKFADNFEAFTPVEAQEATLRVIDAAYANGGSGGGNGGGTGGGGRNKHALLPDKTALLANGQLHTIALMGRLIDSSATIVVIRQEPDGSLFPHSGD